MDNHLHLIVHVPPVPEKYWLDPQDEPAAYAFGMRPPECRIPLWNGDSPRSVSPRPDLSNPNHARTDAEDCPRRPPVGFMLDDKEMLGRLRCIYGDKRVEAIGNAWEALRTQGRGDLVDAHKERYCRRMYNLSQYLKTLKEKTSVWYNETYQHQGTLWQGRFYSGVVERKHKVLAIVAAYVAYNPVKAKIAPAPSAWKWSSYALAVNGTGALGIRCRTMYERMFGQCWNEVRATLESIYADELPPGVTPALLKEWFDDYDEEATDANGNPVCQSRVYRASQAIRASMKVFRTGAYITEDFGFLKKIENLLPMRFPCAGKRAVKRCRAFLWDLPERRAA